MRRVTSKYDVAKRWKAGAAAALLGKSYQKHEHDADWMDGWRWARFNTPVMDALNKWLVLTGLEPIGEVGPSAVAPE